LADLERCLSGLRAGRCEDFPLGVYDHPTRFQLPQRLYGRSPQLESLRQGFERVSRGVRPELFLVQGYSGSGKSALVHELHRPVVRQRGFFLQGKFEQLQRDIPYAPLAQALRGLTQQLLAGTDEEIAGWRQRLRAAWGGQGRVLLDLVPQLELIVGPQPEVPELPPLDARRRIKQVFRQLLSVFATPAHPLVLFLDDLQWADMASLRLVHHLLTHEESPPMLIIGAYRDNEVSASHPLAMTLEEVRQAGAPVSTLPLAPLGPEDVRQLITDALPDASAEVVQPLAEMAREKTGGNPFFLTRFLLALHQDGLLARTHPGAWHWNEEAVRARGYSDNVVDFMVDKLRELPASTQHLIGLAACVGTSFTLDMLGIVSHSDATEVQRGLEPALQEGLLTSMGPQPHRFLHDRVQQAAYALMSPAQRESAHLRIARLLLANLSAEELRERLFDVVGQFNAGLGLLSEPGERHRVALLNAEAGAKARASSAHASAVTYFTTAFSLLPGDPWETEPALAFQWRLAQASSEFVGGHTEVARGLMEELRLHVRTNMEWASLYRLKSELFISQGNYDGACEKLLEGLARMGMPLPARPSREEAMAAHEEVWALMNGRSIESLVELPLMTDPDVKARMTVLAELTSSAYFIDANLTLLHLCRMVSLCLRHGQTAESVHAYAMYGVVLGDVFQRQQEGHALVRTSLEVLSRHGFTQQRVTALFCLEMSGGWVEPFSQCLEVARETFRHAVQQYSLWMGSCSGDHIMAFRLALGHDLESVHQESLAHVDFATKAGFPDMRDVQLATQAFVRHLRGRTASFDTWDGEGFVEADFESLLTPQRMSGLRGWYWVLRMYGYFLAGAHEEARAAGDKALALVWSLPSPVHRLLFHGMRALTLAACCARAAPDQRAALLQGIQDHQRHLETFARLRPENGRVLERMVAAELARVTGRRDEALEAYEEALQAAREYGLIQYAALASELAANYWRERRISTVADAYAEKAREAYLRWGALGKVRQLDARRRRITSGANTEESVTDTDSTQIDALTVVKAQQAISGEIVLERLATTLLRVAIENAGARRGALLVPEGGRLPVVAFCGEGTEGGGAPDASEALPSSLIAYVRRTHEAVLIQDASQPHPFTSDPWFERHEARSVLCLPLLRQGELRGLLYLENDLATEAFTPSRIALLGHLASQATTSIENARLYANLQRAESALRHSNDELEKRVEERTRELRRAQAILVETARSAGMAEVATNVLHNVGNVLTSTVINLDVMRQTLELSRMGRLKKVTSLMEVHRDDLARFLTESPQGSHLADYLFVLADELLREQASLQECVGTMGMHVEHIRAIVQVQQTHARSSLVPEECDLRRLVEDALAIQMPALTRHGVNVTRQLELLPSMRVDKHKVLQILVNLISNAKNAMRSLPDGEPRLHVSLDTQGACARIQVVDNGVGIALENRQRLFSQGFSRFEGGHGLGLHSSALAAKMMGGSLQ
ncbi:MAG: AAA family ATPase, partial [Cystobacter sp.]